VRPSTRLKQPLQVCPPVLIHLMEDKMLDGLVMVLSHPSVGVTR
jgi:hypothetical protein